VAAIAGIGDAAIEDVADERRAQSSSPFNSFRILHGRLVNHRCWVAGVARRRVAALEGI
jgi:hypothetical protein